MTALTLEEQKKLKDKLWPHCEWRITRNGLINDIFDPDVYSATLMHAQRYVVLEDYAKNHSRGADGLLSVQKSFEISDALRTGDLDQIARDIIGETK